MLPTDVQGTGTVRKRHPQALVRVWEWFGGEWLVFLLPLNGRPPTHPQTVMDACVCGELLNMCLDKMDESHLRVLSDQDDVPTAFTQQRCCLFFPPYLYPYLYLCASVCSSVVPECVCACVNTPVLKKKRS